MLSIDMISGDCETLTPLTKKRGYFGLVELDQRLYIVGGSGHNDNPVEPTDSMNLVQRLLIVKPSLSRSVEPLDYPSDTTRNGRSGTQSHRCTAGDVL